MSNSDHYEEGEIRDDYEYIISSDEECSMIQRIKELEATNDELEKIARISGSYSNQYNYVARSDAQRLQRLRKACATGKHLAAYIPSDVSSISSGELPFPTPKKKKRHKKKSNRSKTHEQTHLTHLNYRKHPSRRHQHNKNNGLQSKRSKHNFCHTNRTRMYYENVLETISLDSSSSSEADYHESLTQNERRDSGALQLNRDELRLALVRSGNIENYTANLRDRLQCEKNASEKRAASIEAELIPDVAAQVCAETNVKQNEDSDGSLSLEEQELRLIALKSAVMKKHMARKKRNAEVAYSPTDFDVLAGTDDNMDIVDLDDMPADMNLSPIQSPKLIVDTEQDIEELSSGAASTAGIAYKKNTGDTKSVDMDIANSESGDDIEIIECSDANFKWTPLDMLMPEMCMPYSMPYGIYMPEMQYEPPPPPPPLPPPPLGVVEYEDTQPPLPPNSLNVANYENVDVHSDCSMECASENEQVIQPVTKDLHCLSTQENSLDSLVLDHKQTDNAVHSDEEEEKALRALLLANLQSPKHSKSNSSLKANQINNNATNNTIQTAEEIDTKQMSTIQELKKNPTESILKEAVRRLKIKTTTECDLDFDTENELKQDHNMSSRKSQNNSPLAMQNSDNKSNRTSPDVLSTKENLLNIVQEKTAAITTIPNRKHKLTDDILTSAPKKCSKVFVRSVDTINEAYVIHNRIKAELEQTAKNFNTKSANIEPQQQYAIEANNIVYNFNNKPDLCVDKALKAKVQILDVSKMPKNNNKINVQFKPLEQFEQTVKEQTPSYVRQQDDARDMLVSKCNINADQPKTATTNGFAEQNDTAALAPKQLEANVVALAEHRVPLAKPINAVEPTAKQTLNTINMHAKKLVKNIYTKQRQMPLLAAKIVKPNKIINTNIKLKTFDAKQMSKKLVISEKTANTATAKAAETALKSLAQNSRLLTVADLAKTTAKQLIISLRPNTSDSEITSDDEAALSNSTKAPISICTEKPNQTMSGTINNDYYDNASPISLPMESPSDTPLRSNSPCIEAGSERIITKDVVNDFFEHKLNSFLRDVRSKVQQNVSSTVPTAKLQTDATTNYTPPVAVRHLPKASQKEYQNLLHRMKILEKQKHSKCTKLVDSVSLDADANDQKAILQSLTTALPTTKSSTSSSNTAIITNSATVTTSPAGNKTLIKKVLIKNATCNNDVKTRPTDKSIDSKKPSSHTASHNEPSKTNVLRAYESSFLKIGTSMIASLNKSLKLVDEAKKAKIAKLCHEHRLKELRLEMEQEQHKLNQAEKSIKRINPEIRSSNNVLISLRQRRTKLFQAATSLGKSIKGDDYRLNSEIKHEISMKTKKLAAEIKHVNSIKYNDIAKLTLDSTNDENNTTEQAEVNSTHNTNAISLLKPNDKEIIGQELKQSATLCNVNVTTTNASIDKSEENKTKVQNEEFTNSDKPHCDMLGKESAHAKDNIPCAMVKNSVEAKEVTEECHNNDATDNDNNSSDENREKAAVVCQKEAETRCMQAEQTTSQQAEECSLLSEYISPLANLRTQQSDLDPTGIICPYELRGQCEDNDCSYIHLADKVKIGKFV